MAYEPTLVDGGFHFAKIPALRESVVGSASAALAADLDVVDTDLVITKKSFSCFPGTPLQSVLTSLRVDTLLIAGCSTSACVRATATDAIGLGFRPIVIREAVGDRASGPHVWNLFDIDAKFGDVESLDTVLAYLHGRLASLAD
jgi:nicotinamidase-related amidase